MLGTSQFPIFPNNLCVASSIGRVLDFVIACTNTVVNYTKYVCRNSHRTQPLYIIFITVSTCYLNVMYLQISPDTVQRLALGNLHDVIRKNILYAKVILRRILSTLD